MSLTTDATRFDATTVVQLLGDGTYALTLDDSWSSLRGIHGGYLAALSVRVAQHARPDRPVRTLTTAFLRPAVPGPASAVAELQRDGRSVSTLTVAISQRDALICTTRLTLMDEATGHAWDHDAGPDVAPFEACVPVNPPGGIGHFDQAEGRLDPAQIPFANGERAGIAGWVRPLGDQLIDPAWLAMVMDWFPPAAFTRTQPPVGGVSIDYTVHLHRTTASAGPGGWMPARFRCEVSSAGLALERGTLWSPTGNLVAESFHTRWTA